MGERGGPPADVVIRDATRDELTGVCNVLDGAALETDRETIRESVAHGETVLAVGQHGEGTVVGALVRQGAVIDAVAVRRRRRGQGIGAALVERAARDAAGDRLVAEFDESVKPFYEGLGFAVEPVGNGRWRGERV